MALWLWSNDHCSSTALCLSQSDCDKAASLSTTFCLACVIAPRISRNSLGCYSIECHMQDKERRARWERILVQFQCQAFVASWTGVVRYHGPRPVARPNHVWVSNHTSMIDYIILTAYSPFAVIMQLHAGWIRFLQTQVLQCLGCLWFNRTEVHPLTAEHVYSICQA